ncbi:MAG TPA: DUF547 domain-containing protein, partial [Phaeodactylibacter sp.]|nr:DUF547 domain-containing protein [Phaeodactylibacter sp.]
MISRFILFSFFILGNSFFTNAQDLTSFFQKTNHFLKIVVHDGQVDYTFVKNNKNIINELTNIIATTSPDNLSPSERKAYLINAYNLLVIKSIADR